VQEVQETHLKLSRFIGVFKHYMPRFTTRSETRVRFPSPAPFAGVRPGCPNIPIHYAGTSEGLVASGAKRVSGEEGRRQVKIMRAICDSAGHESQLLAWFESSGADERARGAHWFCGQRPDEWRFGQGAGRHS